MNLEELFVMSNGNNEYGVSYSKITWFNMVLNNHDRVSVVERSDDIIFNVTMSNNSKLKIICLDEYSFGKALLTRVLQEYPDVNIIYVGGNWNGYIKEVKEICLKKQIGLFNSSEINGALWKENEIWNYHKKDDKGNPEYQFRD